MDLFPNEELNFTPLDTTDADQMSDEEINIKYVKGDVRIVTEQARYPLPSIVPMVESGNYELNPEFQRRHRWDYGKKSRLKVYQPKACFQLQPYHHLALWIL